MSEREERGGLGGAFIGGLIGVLLIALAVVSWWQFNGYATAASSPGRRPPLVDLAMVLARPVVPLFESSSGKGSPAAYARAIEATLATVGLLGAGVIAVSVLVRNAGRSAD